MAQHLDLMNLYRLFLNRIFGPITLRPGNSLDNKGYTLVELIIVSAVIAILAAMAIPVYNNYVDKTKTGKAKADIRTLCTEINAYILDNNGAKPANLAAIKRLGFTDAWGRPYVYTNSALLVDVFGIALNKEYDVYSLGRDGLPNTMDEIVSFSDGAYVDLR